MIHFVKHSEAFHFLLVAQSKSTRKFVWKWYHTLILFTLAVIESSAARTCIIFNNALADSLSIKVGTFSSTVMVSFFLGGILSGFLGTFNEKCFNNSKSIAEFYSYATGAASIAFSIPR